MHLLVYQSCWPCHLSRLTASTDNWGASYTTPELVAMQVCASWRAALDGNQTQQSILQVCPAVHLFIIPHIRSSA